MADRERLERRTSVEDLYAVLASEQRRRVLHYLAANAGQATVGRLTDVLAEHADVPSRQRARIALEHRHLPRLVEADLVAVDDARVSLTAAGRTTERADQLVREQLGG